MGKRGLGRKFRGIKSIFKKRGWGRISSCRELYTTLGLGVKKAMCILPRVPEWWIINLATMRQNVVLLPGTTQLQAGMYIVLYNLIFFPTPYFFFKILIFLP